MDGNFLIFSDKPIKAEETLEQILYEKISILETENKSLKEGLQADLNGDMQSLAYMYPEDFTDVNENNTYPEDFTDVNENNTTLEI